MTARLHVLIQICVLVFCFIAVQAKPGHAPPTVSVAWLAEHIKDPNLVLLHIGDKAEYDAGHIAGALFISLRDISVEQDNGKISLQLAPADDLKETFERLGISNSSRIILYFGKDWVTPTTRVYFTLDYLGLSGITSLLDGGMPAWTKAGHGSTAEVKTPARGSLKINPKTNIVADANWVRYNLNKPTVSIIDARTTNFYDGTSVGNKPRGGHIRNAKSVPFNSLVNDDNTLKTEAELRKIFSDAGVKNGDTVVTYCHIGQQASLAYFAARTLGFGVKLYDGSFEEWSERSDLPVDDPKKDDRATSIQLVSPEWVAARVNDPDVRIIDVRNNVYDYFVSHIPNAVHLADAAMRGPRAGYPTQYLDLFVTSRLLVNAGVRKDDRVVLYSDGTSVLGATMMAYILERIGHKKIFLINGGWSDYKEKLPVAKEYPKYETGGYDVFDNRAGRATLDDVKASIGRADVKFVDARPPDHYTGEVNTWVRNGHIPNAINIPWKNLVDENNPHRLKSLPELGRVYADAGLTKDTAIIVYCGTSREASLEYVILKHLLGFPNVRLYEGSWAEYAAHPELAIEKGAAVAGN